MKEGIAVSETGRRSEVHANKNKGGGATRDE